MALITPESVGEAAKALRAEGEKVSVRNVRLYLGGGSPNQILTILRALNDNASDSDAGKAAAIPDEVLSSIRKAMTQAGDAATKAAQAEIRDLLTTQKELSREVQGLSAENGKLQNKVKAILVDLAGREKDVAFLESKVEQLRASKLDAMNKLERERKDERERGDKLAAKLADEQRKRAIAETKTEAAMEKAEQADLRLSSVSFQLEGAFRELEKLRAQLEKNGE